MTNKSENTPELKAISSSDESLPGSMRESISALVDGEATDLEIRRVLKLSESVTEVGAVWSRYQVVSSAMRDNALQAPMVDLSAAIRASIDSDEAKKLGKSPWLQGLVKTGIAASVAVVMVLTTQIIGVQDSDLSSFASSGSSPVAAASDAQAIASANPAVSLPAGFQAPSLHARVVSSQAGVPVQASQPRYYPVVAQVEPQESAVVPSLEVQAYLQRVMEVHAGNAAMNSGRGMLPYARVPVTRTEQP